MTFGQAYMGMVLAYNHMASSFGQGMLRPLPQQFNISSLTIEAANKWLVPRRFAPTAPSVPFTLTEDPNMILAAAITGRNAGFARTSHLVVEYREVTHYDNYGNAM